MEVVVCLCYTRKRHQKNYGGFGFPKMELKIHNIHLCPGHFGLITLVLTDVLLQQT